MPKNLQKTVSVGVRVQIPFGRRKMIGIVTDLMTETPIPVPKLRSILDVLDEESVFEPDLFNTLRWLSRYYHAPIGEVMAAAMPPRVRKGAAQHPPEKTIWTLSELGKQEQLSKLRRAPLQSALVERLRKVGSLSREDFEQQIPISLPQLAPATRSPSSWLAAMKSLEKKRWVERDSMLPILEVNENQILKVELNDEQALAVEHLLQAMEQRGFSCSLLHGVTGSGKTEVYFKVIRQVLECEQQVLLIVPEIGLTPQLIARIDQAFSVTAVVLHSGLSELERQQRWWFAKTGQAKIVVGTRSTVFTSMPKLGLIVVDEEHDASFKQQDGTRYHARDVAIYRAKQSDIPIILGSATPSLESYRNALESRYSLVELKNRALETRLPKINLVDTRKVPTDDGLSQALVAAMRQTLANSKQVLLFLNRRGYAPVLYCKACRSVSHCHRCEAALTFHLRGNQVRCHHCGYQSKAAAQCRSCGAAELVQVGEGTQRVEEAVQRLFPDARIARIDRDTTTAKGELERLLSAAANHEFDILLGTQLITKGHDFSDLALVGVLNADQGLYSTDFRSTEALFQQLVQVAGRAGRREKQGQVYIQTEFVDHSFFGFAKHQAYSDFAHHLLNERSNAALPPFTALALMRCEAHTQSQALEFLGLLRDVINAKVQSMASVVMGDPVPAPLERRAGRYRCQLLLRASSRSSRDEILLALLSQIENHKKISAAASKVRWSLDVDPLDLF